MITLCEPTLGEAEKQALNAVIDSGWLTMGNQVKAFERAFATLHQMEDAVAVSSCTAGLHLCLAALGIKPGDEILVPALTFAATVNAILYVNAAPVLTDIESIEVPHISLDDARSKCTSRTRAVIVMHYGGYPADMQEWRTFADERGLKLIEDAAHCPAAKDVGRFSDAAAFSFFSNKNMTTAEGGMVTAREPAVLEHIRLLRSHAMTSGTLDRHRGRAYTYDITALGYNYRMDELRAALGLAQLKQLPQWNARRQVLADLYRHLLNIHLPQVSVPFRKSSGNTSHIMPVVLPETADREKIMIELYHKGVQSSIHYHPIHLFSYYKKMFPNPVLPQTEKFAARELTLPLHPGLNENDIDRVVGALSESVLHD
ncbi:DegT/DnrJ/EryC1/StrS family aminotransferase [Desulfococcaceae bacterium HSG9]|nr:DegT/DnrJ/EryC1/StrS family aminotransferase [Desulfococcaceae bacterium HSG9]